MTRRRWSSPTDPGRSQILPLTGWTATAEQALAAGGYRIALAIVLAIGLAVRLYLATHSTYIWDEEREWIPVALSISLSPEQFHLPLRTDYHGALAAYLIRLGHELVGDSHLAFRAGSVLSGTLTILVVAAIAQRFAGRFCAIVAAAFVAVNEFHIMMSAVAIQTAFYMLFEALAVLWFMCLLDSRRPVYLYLCALAAALGFLTYEIGALLLPVFVIAALPAANRWVWRSPHLYVAATLAGMLVLPDLAANLGRTSPSGSGYGTLLDRFGSLGFKPVYVAFLFRSSIETLYHALLGRPSPSEGSEYMAMNDVLGLAIFMGVACWLWTALRGARPEWPRHGGLLLAFFFLVYGFFLLIRPPAGSAVAHWVWVGVVLIPGAVLAGGAAARGGWTGTAIAACLVLGAAISLSSLVGDRMGMKDRVARTEPELLVGPEGSMTDVVVHFDVCDACGDPGAPVLRDIAIEQPGGRPPLSVLGGGDVAGVEPQSSDTRFALRVMADDTTGEDAARYMARVYNVTYDMVTDGITHSVTAEARVPYDKSMRRPRVFWSNATWH